MPKAISWLEQPGPGGFDIAFVRLWYARSTAFYGSGFRCAFDRHLRSGHRRATLYPHRHSHARIHVDIRRAPPRAAFQPRIKAHAALGRAFCGQRDHAISVRKLPRRTIWIQRVFNRGKMLIVGPPQINQQRLSAKSSTWTGGPETQGAKSDEDKGPAPFQAIDIKR